MLERRFNANAQIRTLQHRDGEPNGADRIAGYAAVFGAEFVLFEDSTYRVVETIAPGAFSDVLGDDTRCLFNHDADNVLGRTENGTLTLRQDSVGLRFTNQLDRKTTVGNNVYQFVKRGDVTGCSFAFVVEESEYSDATQADGRKLVTRTIKKIKKLYDVGPVTYPAYEATSVSA